MDNWIGKQIGRYKVIELLGQGGMALVYKVYDSQLNRFAALKVIRHDAFPPEIYPKIHQRFQKEAHAMAMMSHHSIVRIYEYGSWGNIPYLVMELVEGGSLKNLLGKPLPEAESAALLASIADGLDYAHRQGVYHRDVKPSNILLRKDGSPVLTDFGIAKITENPNAEGRTYTESTVGVGTPEYMAPEQSLGQKVDARVDQYSLGTVFYEMLTGIKPFDAETPMGILIKQTKGELPDPKSRGVRLSRRANEIFKKCLDPDPEKRYPTMKDFSDELRKLSKGKSDNAFANLKRDYTNNRKTPIVSIIVIIMAVIAAFAGAFYFREQIFSGLPGGMKPVQPEIKSTVTETANEITTNDVTTIEETFTPTVVITNTQTFTSTPTKTEEPTNTPTATMTPIAAPTPMDVKIGFGKTFFTLDDTWNGLPKNSGRVRILLDDVERLNGIIQVPTNKGITEVILDSEQKHTINCTDARLYANGIPLTIEKNLTLSGMSVFGGGIAVGSDNVTIPETNVVINGTVSDVYAGGEIRGEGIRQGYYGVTKANLSINGSVLHNVYGGGYAVGRSSESRVEESHIYLSKRAQIYNILYYGGFAGSVCPADNESCGKEHGKVTMGTVYADIIGNVRKGINTGSQTATVIDKTDLSYYSPSFKYVETEASKNQPEAIEPVFQEIQIGYGKECLDLNCAMAKINPDTTDLNIIIGYRYAETYTITIPYLGMALERVTIDAEEPTAINMQEHPIYANGIHLTIGQNITMTNATIYAGGFPENGTDKKDRGELTIQGNVSTVFAGGAAIFPNVVADSGDVVVTVTGTVETLYGGGYSVSKGAVARNTSTTLILANGAKVRGNLFFGGAAGNYCERSNTGILDDCENAGRTVVENVYAAVYGEVVGEVVEDGYSTDGAFATITDYSYIEAPDPEMMDVSYPQIIKIGDYESEKTLKHALQSVRYPGKDVIFQLTGKLNMPNDIEMPVHKGIQTIRFESNIEGVPRTLDLLDHMFLANGIPVTFSKDISILNGPVFAGGQTYSGTQTIDHASLTIEGLIQSNVYAGSVSRGVGVSDSVCIANVKDTELTISGTVQSNVFAGGYSIGSGSKSNITGTSRLILTNTSIVQGNVYFGGNSQSEKDQSLIEYCTREKKSHDECSPENISVSTTVNRTEASLYGIVLGTVVENGQSAEEKSRASLADYQYMETTAEYMDLQNPLEIRIGPYDTYSTFTKALQSIYYTDSPKDVIIYVTQNMLVTDDIEVPFWKNISSFHIESDRTGAVRALDISGNSIFANGVPLTIGSDIILSNTSVYAGKFIQNETNGGAEGGERVRTVTENASVTILGSVPYVYGGGKAIGDAAEEVVNQSEIKVSGTVQRAVYGGGAAINGAYSLVENVSVYLAPEAKVSGNIYCGGYAEVTEEKGGTGEALLCYSTIEACSAQASYDDCFAGYNGNQFCVSGLGNSADNSYSFTEVNSSTIHVEQDFPEDHILESGLYLSGGDGFVGAVNYQ